MCAIFCFHESDYGLSFVGCARVVDLNGITKTLIFYQNPLEICNLSSLSAVLTSSDCRCCSQLRYRICRSPLAREADDSKGFDEYCKQKSDTGDSITAKGPEDHKKSNT